MELSFGYSRSAANANLPAEYAYRKFLAFRGFGGPNCGVSVVTDPSSPSGMGLGALNSALAGQGNCMYYNPFSNAHQHSAPPGALYLEQPNPDYAPGLDNSPELIDWINEEVDLDSSTDLFVADAADPHRPCRPPRYKPSSVCDPRRTRRRVSAPDFW